MEQSSRHSAKPLRGLRRLRRISDQQTSNNNQEHNKHVESKSKKQNKKRSRSKKKKQVKEATEQETAEEPVRQADPVVDPVVEDRKASLYKSSEDEDDETPIGFVGLETKVTKKRQPKRQKKSIKVSNRFFKQQNFDNFGPQQAPPAYELCQLQIQKKQVQPKSASVLLLKAEEVKKHRGIHTSQHEVIDNHSMDKNIKEMLSRPIDDTREVEIQIDIPRHNAGKNNAILDGTLFVKQNKTTITIQAEKMEQPQLKKKARSRVEYFKQMNDDIKNRKSMRMSLTDICEAFVPSTLDELEKKEESIEILGGITQGVEHKENIVTVLVKTTSRETNKLSQKQEAMMEKEEQKEAKVEIKQEANQLEIRQEETKKEETRKQEARKEETKKELKAKQIKPKKKPKKPKKPEGYNIFQDEAQESGNDNPSDSQEDYESQMNNLIEDDIVYDKQNQQRARQKYHEQEMEDDKQIMRRILKRQFKKVEIDKKQQNKNKRVQNAKTLLDKRDEIEQLLPIMPLITEPEQESNRILEKPTKVVEIHHKWTFSQPIPSQPQNLKRRSLLPSSSNAIRLPRQQTQNSKYVGSAINKIIKPM